MPKTLLRSPVEGWGYTDAREDAREDVSRYGEYARSSPVSLPRSRWRKLLRREGVGEVLFEFMGIPSYDRGWNASKEPFVFGPRTQAGEGPNGWTMAEAYYARVTGQWLRLSKPEMGVWLKRLLVDAGIQPPADFGGPVVQLPARAPEKARKVWQGYIKLLEVAWLDYKGAPVAYSRGFAAKWCGMGERQAYEGLRWLIDHDYIIPAGKHNGRTSLYLPHRPNSSSGKLEEAFTMPVSEVASYLKG